MTHRQMFIVGAGSMAEAFIRGVTKAGVARPRDIHVINRNNTERLTHVVSEYQVQPAASWGEAAEADVLVLAVKPADAADALRSLAPYVDCQLLISFAAGVTLPVLGQAVQTDRVIRAMPNLPVSVQRGVTAVTFGAGIGNDEQQMVVHLLDALGDVVVIPETMMDAATAVSGSGPGFLCYFLEAVQQAAVELGLPPDVARRMILGTMAGTSMMLTQWNVSPEELRHRVTSPNGTTEAGIERMNSGDVRSEISRAIIAAANRAAEIGASCRSVSPT